MEKNKQLRGFQGIFLKEKIKQQLIALQKKGLESNMENMHITFKYGNIEKYPEKLIGKEFKIKVTGYGSDGKNSGFSVELPEELRKYYKSSSIPHITVSIGEVDGVKGKPINTAKLHFKTLAKPIEIKGKLGYFIFGKGISMDNKIINEHLGIIANDNVLIQKGIELNEETKKKIEECLIFENENVRVFNSKEGVFCSTSYYSEKQGKVIPSTVTINGKSKSITVSMADGGEEISAKELVQELWGIEAGGYTAIAGSPRGQEMTEKDMQQIVKIVNERYNKINETNEAIYFEPDEIEVEDKMKRRLN